MAERCINHQEEKKKKGKKSSHFSHLLLCFQCAFTVKLLFLLSERAEGKIVLYLNTVNTAKGSFSKLLPGSWRYRTLLITSGLHPVGNSAASEIKRRGLTWFRQLDFIPPKSIQGCCCCCCCFCVGLISEMKLKYEWKHIWKCTKLPLDWEMFRGLQRDDLKTYGESVWIIPYKVGENTFRTLD